MDMLGNIAASVSVSAVIIGAVYIICPNGVMKRSAEYIIGLVMLCALIIPVTGADIEISVPSAKTDFTVRADGMLSSQAEYIVKSLFEEENITFGEIAAETDISDDGSIIISSVTITGVSDPDKAKRLLSPYCSEVTIKND